MLVADALVEAEAGKGGLREEDVLIGVEEEDVLGEKGGVDLEAGGGREGSSDDGVCKAGGEGARGRRGGILLVRREGLDRSALG